MHIGWINPLQRVASVARDCERQTKDQFFFWQMSKPLSLCTLPYSFKEKICLCTDGEWTRLAYPTGQTFVRNNSFFLCSGVLCFVGKKSSIKMIAILIALTPLLLMIPATGAGLLKTQQPPSTEAPPQDVLHPDLQVTTSQEMSVPEDLKSLSVSQEAAASANPGLTGAPSRKKHSNIISPIDPMRCKSISNEVRSKSHSDHKHLKGVQGSWYVCH